MTNWSNHRDKLYQQLNSLGEGSNTLISNPSGSVVISQASYGAFSGIGRDRPYAVFMLCVGGGGRTVRKNNSVLLDDIWQPGRAGFALPESAAEGFTPAMDTLAIAFDIDDIPACHSGSINPEELRPATRQLLDDTLLTELMLALLRNAECHGAASAFFDHGVSLLIYRLTQLLQSQRYPTRITASNCGKLEAAMAMMDTRLDGDLRVTELAHACGLDAKTFTRTFKRQTGYTPYQYLTFQRMKLARLLLLNDTTVTETALRVGYSNPAKFAAAFKHWVGSLPSQWKHSHNQ